MAITTSGEIKLSDIFKDQNETTDNPSTNANLSLDSFSDSYASAAQVGQGIANQTGSTTQIRAEFAADTDRISHFYGAAFPGGFKSSLNSDGTGTMELYIGSFNNPTNLITNKDTTLVGTENLVIRTYNSGLDGDGGSTDNATATIVQNDGSALTGTNSNQTGTGDEEVFSEDDGHFEISLSSVNLDNTFEGSTLKVKVEDTNNSFDSNFSDTFTYRDKIAGGDITLTASPTSVTDSDDACTVTMATSTTDGVVVNVANTTVSAVTSGDGGTIAGSVVEIDDSANITVSNTPGVIQVSTDLRGRPTTSNSSRNRETGITKTISIPYTRQITNVQSQGLNNYLTGTSVTMQATSKGVNGINMKLGYGTSNSNSTFTDSQNKSISDSRYSADTQTQAFTINHSSPNSSTSRESYYSKAEYNSGAATTTAGSLFLIYPNLVYSKIGNKTVDVNGSAQTFSATLTSGYNAGMTISTDFSGVANVSGFGNNMSITPSTNNGVFTITYTGTADQNSNDVKTSTLTVRPTISLTSSTSAVFSMPETGNLPTGTYAQAVSLSTSEVGANGSSQYNWTFPGALTGWQTTSGGGTGDSTAAGNFSSGLRSGADGDEDISITLTKNGATSTSDSVTIAVTTLEAQELTNFSMVGSTTVRRGESNGIQFGFRYKNIEACNIYFPLDSAGNSATNLLASAVSLNGDSSPNTSLVKGTLTYNVPELSVSTTGKYNVLVRDNDSNNSFGPQLYGTDTTVKDKLPSTPGNFSTTAGGYSGTQAIAWSSGGYQARYRVYRATSEGGSYSLISSPTSATHTITEDSNDTLDFWYKVLAENDNSYVDNNGGPSTSDEQSSYNTARNFIIFPVGANTKNVIQNSGTIIYSTLNNSTSTSHTFSSPSNATDAASIASYAYSRSSGTSVNSSITNANTATATINAAGTGTGTSVINLTTTLNGGNESNTTCSSDATIYVYHYPKINPIANGSGLNNGVSIGTVRAGLDIISAAAGGGIRVDYQGYRSTSDLTLRARIVEAGTTNVITVDSYISFGTSGDFPDSHLTAQDKYIFDAIGNFQEITSTTATSGTLQFKFVNQKTSDPNSGTWWDIETFSITQPEGWLLYQGRSSTHSTAITGIYTNSEQAYLDTSTESNNEVKVFPASAGAPTVGDDLLVLQADGGYSTVSSTGFVSIYRTNNGLSSTYSRHVLQLTGGNVDAIFNTSQITPRAPSGASASVTANSGGATPTVTVTWTRNSSHNTAVELQGRDQGGSYSTLYTLSASDTSESFTETNNSAPSANLSTSVISGTQINLSWSVSGHDSFTVTFGTGGSYTNGGTLATSGTSHNHTGLSAGVTYYYKITATKNGKSREYRVRNTRSANSSGYQNSSYNVVDEIISLGNRVVTDQETATTTSPVMTLQLDDVLYTNDSDTVADSNGGSTLYYNGQSWVTSSTFTQLLSAVIPSGMSTALNGNVTVSVSGLTSNLMQYNIQDMSVTSLSTSASGWSGWATSHAIAADSVTGKRIYYRMRGQCPGTVGGTQASDVMTISVSATGATDDSHTATLIKESGVSGCFIAGTPVLMSNGTTKNIEDIVVGDVLSSMTIDGMTLDGDWDSYKDFTTSDISSSTLSTANVESVNAYDNYPLSKRITLSNGETMTVTGTHPIFVYRDGQYIWAKPTMEYPNDNVIDINDKFVNKDKELITIQSLEDVSDSVTVYTLDVEDLDVYFVNGVLVHNKEGPGGP